MANVVVDVSTFPTILTITNLVRSDVRDDMAGATNTVGEGQILVNDTTTSVTMANFFNSAVRELCRKLRIVNAPMLIADNYILKGIPPMNGPMGFQVADPSVQVYIAFNGYFDGSQWHNGPGNSWQLPQGCFQVMRVWERETGSNDVFQDMGEPANGMEGVYQTNGFGRWEWRQNQVCLPGSLDYRDLRLRYQMILNSLFVANANPATTYLPIMGCEEAVARIIDRLYSARQGGAIYEIRKAEADMAVDDLLNEEVQGKQGQEYTTNAYGNEAPPVLNYGQ
jgi:hypothetical protein